MKGQRSEVIEELSDEVIITQSHPHSITQSPHHPITSFGFTLVELMLVVIIIGVLAAMVVPRFAGRTEQAKITRAKADLAAIGLALDLYEMDLGQYPASLNDLVAASPPTGAGDEAQGQWRGPYLKRGLPRDPWSREYQYRRESQRQQDYDLLSLGPDGQPGDDDITSWE